MSTQYSSKGENIEAFDKFIIDNIRHVKICLVAMYVYRINVVRLVENLARYKHQRSALSRNTRNYCCVRLEVCNWSFFGICEVSAVESSSITVKFFSKLKLMNIFLRYLFRSRSQYFLTSFYDCSFDVTSNLPTSVSNPSAQLWS